MTDSCEVCGREGARFITFIEGAKLLTCSSCAKSGKILHSLEIPGEEKTVPLHAQLSPRNFTEEETAVEGYGNLLIRAREKKGLKREEVAKAINEMESHLEHIEKEKIAPPIKVLKKLERFFGIKLIEKSSASLVDESVNIKTPQNKIFTLADVLDSQPKKSSKKEEK